VYEVLSTSIKPAQPVTAPFVPLDFYVSRVFGNLRVSILTRLALAVVLSRIKSADVENPKGFILTPKSDYLTFIISSSFPKMLETYGQYPGRLPPLPPSLPISSQVFIYGDLTAKGIAGGRFLG